MSDRYPNYRIIDKQNDSQVATFYSKEMANYVCYCLNFVSDKGIN